MTRAFRNAFTRNSLGSAREPFPLSVERRIPRGGVHGIHIFPVDLESIGDILIEGGSRRWLVYDVGHYDTDIANLRFIHSLASAADRRGLPYRAYDSDILTMAPVDARVMLAGIHHHNVSLLSIPDTSSDDEVEDLYLRASGTRWARDEWVLPKCETSNLYFHGHDDCYVYCESRDEDMCRRIVSRTLETYAATLLHSAELDHDVQPTPPGFVEYWLPPGSGRSSRRGWCSADSKSVNIGFVEVAIKRMQLSDGPIEGRIVYDVATGSWSIRSRHELP
jgi:hypothetical protein